MAQDSERTLLNQMQDLLLDSTEFPEFLLSLATISASLAGAEGQVICTITVERDGSPATVASSSEKGRRLDETQYSFGDGPCLTAIRQQRLVRISDLRHDERWSDYLEAAVREGIRSVLAVPITTEPSFRAGLNCYADSVRAFPEEKVAVLEQHAASLSRILKIALRLHGVDAHPGQLRAVLRSRAVVDAALSLVMLQQRAGRNDALAILHMAAKSSNRRIHDIAHDIVRGAEVPAVGLDGA